MFRNDIVSQYHTLPREDVRFEKYRSWFLVYGVMCSEFLSGCRCPVLFRLKEQYDCTLLHEEDAYVKFCQLWNMCVTISSIIIIFRGHEANWLLQILSLSCLYKYLFISTMSSHWFVSYLKQWGLAVTFRLFCIKALAGRGWIHGSKTQDRLFEIDSVLSCSIPFYELQLVSWWYIQGQK